MHVPRALATLKYGTALELATGTHGRVVPSKSDVVQAIPSDLADIPNPCIARRGSKTARAPFCVMNITALTKAMDPKLRHKSSCSHSGLVFLQQVRYSVILCIHMRPSEHGIQANARRHVFFNLSRLPQALSLCDSASTIFCFSCCQVSSIQHSCILHGKMSHNHKTCQCRSDRSLHEARTST